ncbi:hypothetical protein FQJ95_23680, partial [Xanthomonas vasicola]
MRADMAGQTVQLDLLERQPQIVLVAGGFPASRVCLLIDRYSKAQAMWAGHSSAVPEIIGCASCSAINPAKIRASPA